MTKKEIILVTNFSDDSPLTFDELCEAFHTSSDLIQEFITFEIIQPLGQYPEDWVFDLSQLRRLRTALRLQHDLEVNLQGIAIILDLLEEIDLLRSKAEIYEKY